MSCIEHTRRAPRCTAQTALGRAIGVLWLVAVLPAAAATVYKTVDDNGVVSYSDTAPAGDVEVETLEIDVQTPAVSESAQQQLEAMRETTDRMVADRQQREKHRAEMRKLQVESRPQVVESPEITQYDGIYTGYYPYPSYRPVYRPVYRPGPGHPVTRPPLRPHPSERPTGDGILSPGYDYPASLVRRGYSPQVRAAFEQ